MLKNNTTVSQVTRDTVPQTIDPYFDLGYLPHTQTQNPQITEHAPEDSISHIMNLFGKFRLGFNIFLGEQLK